MCMIRCAIVLIVNSPGTSYSAHVRACRMSLSYCIRMHSSLFRGPSGPSRGTGAALTMCAVYFGCRSWLFITAACAERFCRSGPCAAIRPGRPILEGFAEKCRAIPKGLRLVSELYDKLPFTIQISVIFADLLLNSTKWLFSVVKY